MSIQTDWWKSYQKHSCLRCRPGVIRCRAGILDWTTNELVNMDRRIKKILPLHGCLHVARLSRVEGQRGLIGTEECVKRENKSLCGYLRKNATNGSQG